jgi:hypothetical protein
MMSTRDSSLVRHGLLAGANVLIFLALTVPFVIPNPGTPILQPLREVHLYIHATLFFCLGLFWWVQLPRSFGWVLPVLAICLEGAQYWIPTRHFSFIDMGFNVCFSSLGYLFASRIRAGWPIFRCT